MHHTSVENMKCRSKEHVSLCWKKDWAHALMFCFVFEVAKKLHIFLELAHVTDEKWLLYPFSLQWGLCYERTQMLFFGRQLLPFLFGTQNDFLVLDVYQISCLSVWHNLVRQIIQMDSFTRRLHVKWWLIWSGNPSWITWTLPCREVCFAL